jgi:hypothetical protein
MAERSEQLWPSINEGQKPEPPFIHPFVANPWSSKHHTWHKKRPAATFDRQATLRGVDRAVYSLTGCSTSRGSAALTIRSASSHHSNGLTTATSRNPALALPAAYTTNAVPAIERTDISRFTATLFSSRLTNYGILANIVQLKTI